MILEETDNYTDNPQNLQNRGFSATSADKHSSALKVNADELPLQIHHQHNPSRPLRSSIKAKKKEALTQPRVSEEEDLIGDDK